MPSREPPTASSPGIKGDGIYLNAGSLDVVVGNFIGENAKGTASISNAATGVRISSGTKDKIGGTTAAADNVILGNKLDGIFINKGSLDVVVGNFIGTNFAGALLIGNGKTGVSITGGSHDTIGGLNQVNPGSGAITRTAGNVISGNKQNGIYIGKGSLDIVAGNFIGTNAKGTAIISNGATGVRISAGNRTGSVARPSALPQP